MNAMTAVLFMVMTLILSACQVKEASTADGLISDNTSVTNAFTLDSQSSKTYVAGEKITVTVSFPFNIVADTTGGSPRVGIRIGSTVVYATQVANSNPRKLSFEYTVLATQLDTNGIDVTALELNGSTLKFDNNGVMTNCNVASITNRNLPGVNVDTIGPSVDAMSLLNAPGFYNKGEKINFSVRFTENVYVTGTPQVRFNLGGTTVNAAYASGSGSNLLSFSYTIASGVIDTNGFNSIDAALIMTGATIKDAVANDATVNISPFTAAVITYSGTVLVNGDLPHVLNSTFPSDNVYIANDQLNFTLNFDRPVNVTGRPYLAISYSPAQTRNAEYVSGTGTNTLIFRYIVVPGDVAPSGITVSATVQANSGAITDVASPNRDFFAHASNYIITIPPTTGIKLNATQPAPLSATRNVDITNSTITNTMDNTFNIGQVLNVSVAFNVPVYVDQTNGIPSVPLIIGSTTKQATYLSGGNGQTSLVFRYVIEEGDLDSDGTIALGTIQLNGGVIKDGANTMVLLTIPGTGLPTTMIDGVRPTIATVTPPTNRTYSTITGVNHTNMSFVVNWSEVVHYYATGTGTHYIPMDVGGTSVALEYISGNNTTAITHRPLSLVSRNDADGITLSSPMLGTGTAGANMVKDAAGNTAANFNFVSPNTTGILVDTVVPRVLSVVPITTDRTYHTGENIDFNVTFSESVEIVKSGGYPQIEIVVGSTTRYLTPTTNTTNSVHTFRYTILASETDTDGVVVGTTIATTAPGYARDAGLNLVDTSVAFASPNTAGIKVDTEAPTILSVSAPGDSTYYAGDTLSFTVQYSEPVFVTGSPSINVPMPMNGGFANFVYSSGSTSDTLIFRYTVPANTLEVNGLSTVASITSNGGTILDEGNNAAPSSFTSQNLSAVYFSFPNITLFSDTNFVNKLFAGLIPITNQGSVSTESCGSGTCRTFSGDDSLELGSSLSNVRVLYIVVKAPATGNENFFSTNALSDDGSAYDLTTSDDATVVRIGGGTTSGTIHDINLPYSGTAMLEISYTTAQTFASGTVIPNTFSGAIGEVIAVSGTLTAGQKAAIQAYLNSRY